MNHMIFVKGGNYDKHNNVSLSELIKISNNWIKPSSSNELSKAQFKRICEIVDVILTNSSQWYIFILQ